ncbi:MAG: tetratricopeptide repeat protein [Planctomycetes bacterium]|nr:tetratricopeptide repeat protein [Planctomycetota bacterium]
MRIVACLVFLVAVATAHADEQPKNPLAEARLRWLKGNYAEARELYEAKLKDEKLQTVAAIGVARTYVSEGEYAKALEVLADGLKKSEDDPDLLAAQGDVQYLLGRWDDALKSAEAAIKKKEKHFLARWVRARIFRDRGEAKQTDDEMRWFVRTYTQRSEADDDIKDPDELLIVGLAGTENARVHNLNRQFEFILNEIYVDIVKFEANCWMAEYQAGAMLLEKYNRPQAVRSFDNALKMNPRAAEAFVGKGQAALQGYEIKDAEQYASQALKINPRLPSALRLQADIHLISGEIAKALEVVEEAKKINDHDESTLARLAVCLHLMKQTEKFDQVVAAVKAVNPKPGLFYQELAQALEDRKFYTEAEKFFNLAIEQNDKLAAPKSSLGLLFLRLGKEKEAREMLDKAFVLDRFNVRVANSRKVLTHLEGYATSESKHYILRFHEKSDGILAAFILEFLEDQHAQLAKDFGFEPEGKVLIEVFNNHEMFSGRTVALPDLHTIGACTGRVVTMVSPHGKDVSKRFNWGRVIRHELVHVFNLAQTDFLVPHWLTEGLAVRNEGTGRPPSWNIILRDRFEKNDLLNLDTVLLAFVRPRSQNEWMLAYCQSLLYVEYIIQTYGIASVGKMLDAYRSGLDTDAAIKKVCGVEKSVFEKGYREHVTAIVKALPVAAKPREKALTFAELEKEHEKNPGNADTAANLASEYLRRKRTGDARKLVDAVLEKSKGHPQACIVKAKLLLAGGDEADARKVIESALADNAKDVRLLGYLGRLLLDAKEFAKAADKFEQCRVLDPLDDEWLDQLREVYTKLDDKEKLLDVLREVARNDYDDLQSRRQMAKILSEQKKFAEAETAAREALFIDVLDPDARKFLLQALREQKKDEEAERIAGRYGKESDK